MAPNRKREISFCSALFIWRGEKHLTARHRAEGGRKMKYYLIFVAASWIITFWGVSALLAK
jgi:hypothetical protein